MVSKWAWRFGIWLFVITPVRSVVLITVIHGVNLTRLELNNSVWHVNGYGKFIPC
jgi:hypothetical protein